MDQSDASPEERAKADARALLHQAKTDLSKITAVVDRANEISNPTMEILEASRALHNALMFLSDWSCGGGEEKGVGGSSWFDSSTQDSESGVSYSLELPLPVRDPGRAAEGISAPLLSEAAGDGGKTAFVLGGGGSLGAVQVGMLRALLERGIRPDFVVGASIGSLNGAYLAGHLDLDGVESLGELWSSVRRADVFPINLRRLLGGVMGHRDHLFDELGLRAVIERAGLGFARLEEAPIPVHAVATDLLSGKPVVLSHGVAVDALLASSAIPGIFPPVNVGGRLLVDGGVLANFPVTQAIELGATRVFVLPGITMESVIAADGALNLMQRSMLLATSALSSGDLLRVADTAEVHVLPVPATAQGSIFDFGETQALIEDAYLSSSAWLGARQSTSLRHECHRRYRERQLPTNPL